MASEGVPSCSIFRKVRRGRLGPVPANPLEYMKSRSAVVITKGSDKASVGWIVSPTALLGAGGGSVVEGDDASDGDLEGDERPWPGQTLLTATATKIPAPKQSAPASGTVQRFRGRLTLCCILPS
jgi:hypothetical protein